MVEVCACLFIYIYIYIYIYIWCYDCVGSVGMFVM